jgi:adenine-specific DNA-methyltransferase
MSKSKKPASSSKKSKRPDRAQKRSGDFSRSRTAEAVTTKATKVEIKPAKGRPMLTWVGKKPLRYAIAYPAQLVETYSPSPAFGRGARGEGWPDWPKDLSQTGLLFHGDNKDVLAYLLANGFRGKVKLIYIDPPFDSGADYVRKVELRGGKLTGKLNAEEYGIGEQTQYSDIWGNDNYLQFMYERILLSKELLSEDGVFWMHCDTSRGHYLKCILDEIFGNEYFVNQVIWKRSDAHSDVGQGARHLGAIHDMILVYTKGSDYIWNDIFLPLPESTVEKWYRHVESETGRRYNKADMTGPGGAIKGNPVYEWKGIVKAWRFSKKRMEELEKDGRIVYTDSGMPYLKRYLDESKGVPLQDWWDDIQMIRGIQRRGVSQYPTEKPEALLGRIVNLTSNPGDIVLDCFLGSGTTAAVAQKLGRRWIGADINKGAIQTTIKRLQGVMQEQALNPQPLLPNMGEGESPRPAQLGFSVYRVNDYDLQIQHNEAFNLAVEHLGMTRTKTDAFFDGTLGKKLVKIVPFNHPVTPLDLEEVKKELNNRPEEERDIVVVGLGKEVAVEAWLEEWNKLRNQGNIPNKIEVIELRSDPKYGGFFTHEPAKAKVSFKREKDNVAITIDDFISPTILERLRQQNKDNPLFQPQVSDWRSMVDSVMIDSTYDGKVFKITLADVPEKKNDLVEGKYVVEAKKGAMVAVKVTDMLGEEVLVVNEM